jgi:hypothetical protein
MPAMIHPDTIARRNIGAKDGHLLAEQAGY